MTTACDGIAIAGRISSNDSEEAKMGRTNIAAKLFGIAAAGALTFAIATPAWAQAKTYPAGTDCSAVADSTDRMDCMRQMDDLRQHPTKLPQPAPNSVAPQDSPNQDFNNQNLNNSMENGTAPSGPSRDGANGESQ